MPNLDNEFMTTTEACDVLGVSKTVIKRMADMGELETWKTPGGHRRLKRSSVMQVAEAKNGLIPSIEMPKNNSVNALVIDDDPVIHKLFSSVLASFDLQTDLTTAQDGYEALLKAGQACYDIIFVDLFMPKLDGYEVVKALKQSDQNKGSTIVVITANRDADIDHTRLPADVTVLSKPLDLEVIKQFIRYESRLKKIA